MTREEAIAELRSISRDQNALTPVSKLARKAFQTAAMLRDEGMSRRVENALDAIFLAGPEPTIDFDRLTRAWARQEEVANAAPEEREDGRDWWEELAPPGVIVVAEDLGLTKADADRLMQVLADGLARSMPKPLSGKAALEQRGPALVPLLVAEAFGYLLRLGEESPRSLREEP